MLELFGLLSIIHNFMIYYNENGFLRINQLDQFGSINFGIVINNLFIFFNSIYLLKA